MKRLILVLSLLSTFWLGGILSQVPTAHLSRWVRPILLPDFFETQLGATYFPTPMKSIQYGNVTIAASGTSGTSSAFTAVTLANAAVSFIGESTTGSLGNIFDSFAAQCAFASTTTVTCTRNGSAATAIVLYFSVEEFLGAFVKSNQDFTATIANTFTTGTATLSPAVTVAKTLLLFRGWHGAPTGTETTALTACGLVLTNTTTVTATRGGSTNQDDCYGTALEFK